MHNGVYVLKGGVGLKPGGVLSRTNRPGLLMGPPVDDICSKDVNKRRDIRGDQKEVKDGCSKEWTLNSKQVIGAFSYWRLNRD